MYLQQITLLRQHVTTYSTSMFSKTLYCNDVYMCVCVCVMCVCVCAPTRARAYV
jgi:hypothetical protein